MPLVHSSGKRGFDANISELVKKYKKTGKIGKAKPADLAKARRQALAIAFDIKEK